MKNATIALLFVLATAISLRAQTSASLNTKELYNTLAQLDSALFSTVYMCNPGKNVSFFTEDLEFYHDKGGLTRSRKAFMDGLEKNFCGGQNQKLRRELVKGTLQAFPINNYGAVQMGEHVFYVTEKGQPEKLTGQAKFVHLWKLQNGEWKISRVLSFEHREAGSTYSTTTKELYDTIASMDSVLFAAFNAHDVHKLMAGFTEDLEFYHDKDGFVDYNLAAEDFTKMFQQNNGIKRELIRGSLEVYPINNYGAIETGLHKFCHDENGKKDCGTFPFIMIWQKRTDGWKIARVISYDH